MKYIRAFFLLLTMSTMAQLPAVAQDNNSLETTLKDAVKYRFLGPYRGGRATTAIGIKEKPFTFFMGTTGGGVWKTDDAGNTWDNISDGQIKCGSIGSIAIHPKYSDVMYVGTGSDSPRGNISAGIGIYKSVDGGKTWNHTGLDKTGQIGDIVFHPDNPDVAYVAALGNIFGPNKERGVYKTTDGGKSWKHSFYLSDTVGAVDLAMHPNNPDVLYAGMWRAERKPWTMIDGGKDGGLYKTIDGGATWKKVKNGLPGGLIGRIGVDISPVDPDIIYVIQQTFVEKDGGVYKSTDGGKNFKRINGDHKLRQRGWYYSRIFADPVDKNTVYVTNTGFYRSIDGGNNFDQRMRVPHGDCHSVWINPNNPDIFINTNDGGATITLNGGKTWSSENNQPTSELYRISTDNQFPFRVYAGQQDNTTISVPVRNRGGLDPKQHWLEVGGGESGDVAVSPANTDIVYATTYSGIITRVDLESGERRYVGAYPHYTEGTEQRNLKYRWQWNFPIRVSQHDNNVIYHTSNYVHKSTDEGSSWQVISPDLTRDISAYQDIPGGPVQHDATGVEVYSSIFSMMESPFDSQELWVGSDDGLVHVSKDGGLNWKDVTPKMLPEEATINHIELSKHNRDHIYVVAYNYRYADFRPYICISKDGGKTWSMKVNGIESDHFVRAMAQDSDDPEILYAGTEYGMYVSLNDGTSWEPLQLNLPYTPITDMEVKGNDLVLSTQGRGFWIIDNIGIIRDMKKMSGTKQMAIVQVQDTYISNLGRSRGAFSPEGAPYAVDMYIWSPDSTSDNTISFLDSKGDTCHIMKKQTIKKGLNKLSWNMRTSPPKMVEDLVMMDMRHPGQGPSIPPGTYEVMLKDGDKELKTKFAVKVDPSWKTPVKDFQETYELAVEIADAIENSQKSIMHLRKIADASNELNEREQLKAMKSDLEELSKKSKEIQDMIYQDKIKASQDEINFERKFTNHIIRLYRVVLGQHGKPTAGERERWEDLKKTYADYESAYKDFITSMVVPINNKLKSMELPYIPQDYGK